MRIDGRQSSLFLGTYALLHEKFRGSQMQTPHHGNENFSWEKLVSHINSYRFYDPVGHQR